MIDPDASDTPHWAIYDIPADQGWLSEGISPGGELPAGALELNNYRGAVGYAGPRPPAEHSYRFTLYAVDVPSLGVDTSAGFDELEAAAEAVQLDSGTITGVYGG
jgi:Raf kinase inhibitor-like YbhB/YbcL family protein